MNQASLFESGFKIAAGQLTGDKRLIENLWKAVETSYSNKGRHYHNLSHLDNLFSELLQVKELINDWQTIIFSIAYHDFIYNPLKQDNEEKSAIVAIEKLGLLNMAAEQKEKCRQQILATKGHTVSLDPDTNYFTDADLSVFGADPTTYENYAKNIRKEYKYFPDLLYNPGRRKVLNQFLNMKRIFKTKFYSDKYETQARNNLKKELENL